MSGHDDFHIEPVRGLPERPPEGERILWQGAPDPWVLARRAFACRTMGYYFAALAVWNGASTWVEGGDAVSILVATAWLAGLGLVTMGLLALMAWITARTTVYTITNRRVAMRIGVALTVTLNLPYRWIGSAGLLTHSDGSGDIALRLTGGNKLSYLILWPHVRPWAIRRPQPALRAIPDAAAVAGILADAMRSAEEVRAAADRHEPELAKIAAE